MKHDVIFADETIGYARIREREPERELSGPPMIKMLSVALATGFLFAGCLGLAGAVDFAAGIGIGWCASLAVLALESWLYSRAASSRLTSRRKVVGWPTIGAATLSA